MNQFLPNLFILGAARCGTTSLHSYLAGIPGICMSNPKEPFFFECEYQRGLDHYQKTYFAHWKGEGIIGEARHRNLYLPYVPERIHRVNPNAKLLVILRNPIDRAYSHWWLLYYNKREKLKFPEAIEEDYERIQKGFRCETPEEIEQYCKNLGFDGSTTKGHGIYRTYLDTGYYYEQISRYTKIFPVNQLKVILLEDLLKDPRKIIGEICQFLGLADVTTDKNFRFKKENEKETALFRNVSGVYGSSGLRALLPNWLRKGGRKLIDWIGRDPGMDSETREWLRVHYFAQNRALERFLKRDLSHWNL